MTHSSKRAATPLFYVYRAATRLLVPLAFRSIAKKLSSQGVSSERQRERLGHATLPRPAGQLIWLHGASVGESLAAMTLIEQLKQHLPAATFLLTSGTATSADMAQKRLPYGALHQFAPLDGWGPVTRFLHHWRPDAAIFVESELWPVTLAATQKSGAPIALVNARLSQKSIDGWKKRPDTAAFVMEQFTLILAQNADISAQLHSLGARDVRPAGNLKAGAAPLPVDQATVGKMKQATSGRPIWIASSTHPGEEEVALAAHQHLLKEIPDLLLLLAPRHPERGAEVAALVQNAGLRCARRSTDDSLQTSTQVYLADTLGELGSWYALSPIVFLGGSLLPIGGHNPFEVAQAGAAILTGPGYSNFMETFPALLEQGGARSVHNADTLATAVSDWLTQPDTLRAAQTAATAYVTQQTDQLDMTIKALLQMIPPPNGGQNDAG